MSRKIALVTGGSRGLGKNMAINIAKKGLDVIITYRSKKEEAEQVISDLETLGKKAVALKLDLLNTHAAEQFPNELSSTLKSNWGTGKIDFLINNAGQGATVPFEKVSPDLFDELLNVHFKGVYFLTQHLLPFINDNGGIINISSGTTRYVIPGYSVYSSMKGAVEVLTKCLAKELGPRGIRVNIVAPGPVETDFNNAMIRSNPEIKTRLSSLSPLGRVGNADDIGGVVAFLCTADAKWINGQRIEVSGGINV
ncbi:MAG TPA: SDR family oxidoreductase [Chitinophagaceae bacterium]|nr:SDR family oxidoreductase [Chitinophagaceae bacterium]